MIILAANLFATLQASGAEVYGDTLFEEIQTVQSDVTTGDDVAFTTDPTYTYRDGSQRNQLVITNGNQTIYVPIRESAKSKTKDSTFSIGLFKAKRTWENVQEGQKKLMAY